MLRLSVKMQDKMNMTDGRYYCKAHMQEEVVAMSDVGGDSLEALHLLHKYWQNMTGVTRLVTLFVTEIINIFTAIISDTTTTTIIIVSRQVADMKPEIRHNLQVVFSYKLTLETKSLIRIKRRQYLALPRCHQCKC